MILSDFDLHNAIEDGRIEVKPFDKATVRENGIDFRLAPEIAHHTGFGKDFILDPTISEHVDGTYKVEKRVKEMVIKPFEQVLLSTYERISMPDDIVGFVELRSTWARHGLSMPPTIIDAGFKGNVTLEVVNNAPYSIRLRPKQGFAHIIFVKTSNRVRNPYNGKYLNQSGIRLPKKVDLPS